MPRFPRKELLWCLAGIVSVQVALGLAIDGLFPAIRDPEFAGTLQLLRERRAESPGASLTLCLGSSRTQTGVRAAALCGADRLVFNFGIPGSGPMMQQVALRRVLAVGERPDLVVIEVMPMSFARRGGMPLEERQLDSARLTTAEVIGLWPRYHQRLHLLKRWAVARLWPTSRHQAELCEATGLDRPRCEADSIEELLEVDSHGWRQHGAPSSPSERTERIARTLAQYEDSLADFTPADRPLAALCDLLALCRRERLPTALVMAPECAAFRAAYSGRDAAILTRVRQLASKYDFPLHDARGWIDEPGFHDGHHLADTGADRYTKRLERVAIEPLLEELAARRRQSGEAVAARER